MSLNRTRPRGRRLPVVPDAYEAITEADRRFFERHPDRSHRIRHTGRAELDLVGRSGQGFDPPLPGFRWFTAIRQVAPGCRTRVYLQAPAGCETDVPEEFAAMLYRRSEGQQARAVTANLVAALKNAGAL